MDTESTPNSTSPQFPVQPSIGNNCIRKLLRKEAIKLSHELRDFVATYKEADGFVNSLQGVNARTERSFSKVVAGRYDTDFHDRVDELKAAIFETLQGRGFDRYWEELDKRYFSSTRSSGEIMDSGETFKIAEDRAQWFTALAGWL